MRCWAKNVSKCWQKPWQSLTLWSISSPRWKCHAKIRRTYYSLELVYPFHHFTINIITKVVIIIVTVPWIKWMISNHVKPLYMYKARREKQRENFKGWWSWMSSVRIQAKNIYSPVWVSCIHWQLKLGTCILKDNDIAVWKMDNIHYNKL